MDTQIWLIDAAWISFAFLCGFIARLLKFPPLIGFLAAGFLLNGLGIREAGEALQELADLGVTLLLFTIGLKLDVKSLLRREVWLGTSLHMMITTVVLGGVVFLLTFTPLLGRIPLSTAILIGFALSFSSTVFAIKILEERGELNALHGVTVMGILVMQDIIAVIYLTVSAGKVPSLWVLALPILILLRQLFFKMLELSDHGELLTLFGLFLAIVAGAGSFELVGLKPDLGALLIGIMIGSHPKAKELGHTLMGFKNLFLVAFFLSIGLSGLPDAKIFICSALLSLFMVFKGLLFFRLASFFNFRSRTALFTAVPLANFSEFGLIVAAVGVKSGWLDSSWLILIAMCLTLSFIVGAPINDSVYGIYGRFRDLLKRYEHPVRHPSDQLIELDTDFLIIGMGRIGTGMYDATRDSYDRKVIGLDNNSSAVKQHKESGRDVVFGDVTDIDFWDKIKPEQVSFIILCMPLHEANVIAVKQLKNAGYKGFIAASARFEDQVEELRKMGVHSVYNIYDNLGAAYAEYARNDCMSHPQFGEHFIGNRKDNSE
ncbi:MAG: glutathione-regulated potassium-efflux system ancillary protein KefC [Desulforhopalus sp.]|jgi:glutathione-regulated potassium-efflux system ancillary protein KefC